MITRETVERYICFCGYDLNSRKLVFKNREGNIATFYSNRDLVQAEQLIALFGDSSIVSELSPKVNDQGIVTGFDPKPLGYFLLSNYNPQTRIYDPSKERGLGVWIDRAPGSLDRVMVMNLGDKLIINNEIKPLHTPLTYQYNRYLPIEIGGEREMFDSEGQEVLDVFQKFDWIGPMSASGISLYGEILAGWVLMAMIGGGLEWRPHCWITGQPGSGKSTAHLTASSLLSAFSEMLQSNTSEAGIRQSLNTHARPVLLDESGNDQNNKQIKAILSLIRGSSTETGARTAKGSGTGEVKIYDIRSMFLLGATKDYLDLQQDKERFTILEMQKNPDHLKRKEQEDYVKSQRTKFEVEKYSGRLLKRAIKYFWEITETIGVLDGVFSDGIILDRRVSKHYAILMAGSWFLNHSYVPSREEAKEFLMRFDWANQEQLITVQRDETPENLLRFLLSSKLMVSRVTDNQGGAIEMTVAEVLFHAKSAYLKSNIMTLATSISSDAKAAIERLGMRVVRTKAGEINWFIPKNHPGLSRILAAIEYEKGWDKVLLRLPGAKEGKIEIGSADNKKQFRGVMLDFDTYVPNLSEEAHIIEPEIIMPARQEIEEEEIDF